MHEVSQVGWDPAVPASREVIELGKSVFPAGSLTAINIHYVAF